MKVLYDIAQVRLGPTAVAVGVFDGVHIGHQAVLRQAVATARDHQALAAALTFDPHPQQVLRPRQAPRLLTTVAERVEFIEPTGVEVLLVARFDRAFAEQTPEEFARRVLVERLSARCVVAGEGFVFGRGARGTIDTLVDLGRRLGFRTIAVKRVTADGTTVSSTAVRRLIAAGDLEGAASLLGHYYTIAGEVVRGEGRGRSIGLPTANLCVDRWKLLPPDGVYAATARVAPAPACARHADRPSRVNGPLATAEAAVPRVPAVANIGLRPTFTAARARLPAEVANRAVHEPRAPAPCVEAHLLDAPPDDLYGRQVTLELIARLREERRFPDAEALARQIRRDIAQAREILRPA